MKNSFLIVSFLLSSVLQSQKINLIGIYSENLKLNPNADFIELKADSTFIYSNYGKMYNGSWEFSQNKILLNPKIKKNYATVRMRESKIDSDSVTIKINYKGADSASDATEKQKFKMATVFFDKRKNYVNILKTRYIRTCAWASAIRRQAILNNNSTVTVSKKEFSQIGFMTYHLKDYIIFTRNDKDSNYFEFDIEDVPDDSDVIKDDFLILKGNSLFYHTRKGKKDLLRYPLVKRKI